VLKTELSRDTKSNGKKYYLTKNEEKILEQNNPISENKELK